MYLETQYYDIEGNEHSQRDAFVSEIGCKIMSF